MRDMPDLSVVIVTYKSKEHLPRCLRSIYAATQGISHEVIIVDNGSRDDLVHYLRAEFPDVKMVENEKNEGFARGVNQGVSLASGRYLAILNPDTQLCPETFRVLLSFLEKVPPDYVVGAHTVDEMGRTIPSCRSLPHVGNILKYPLSLFLRGRRLRTPRRFLLDLWDQSKTIDMIEYDGYITAACLVTRLNFFKQIGMFDERYFLYSEDADLGLRMAQGRHHAFLISDAVITHFAGSSADQNPLARLYFVEASLNYVNKHFGFFHRAIYKVCFFLIVLVWTLRAWLNQDQIQVKNLLESLRRFKPT